MVKGDLDERWDKQQKSAGDSQKDVFRRMFILQSSQGGCGDTGWRPLFLLTFLTQLVSL